MSEVRILSRTSLSTFSTFSTFFFGLLLASTAPAQLAINEVLVHPVGANAGKQIVEIRNVSGAAFMPTGWQICAPLTYAAMPSIAVSAGGIVRLHIGASGSNSQTDWYFPLFRTLQKADTFLLYKSNIFTNDKDIVDFLSWGGGTARINQAVNIKQWPNLTATVTLPPAEGMTIAWIGRHDSPAGWFREATPTLGASNGGGSSLTLGMGCPTSQGVPLFSQPLPAIDGNLDYVLSLGGGKAGAMAFFAAGTKALPGGGLPMGGNCRLLIQTDLFVLSAPLDPQGKRDLPLPLFLKGTKLTGFSIHFQALIADPNAQNNTFGMTASEKVTIG